MTEDDIKEELSKAFVQLVASRQGYLYQQGNKDYGIDLTIEEVQPTIRPIGKGKKHYFPTGRSIDLQLKCTCDASVSVHSGGLRYPLRAKNYNDLVQRWQKRPDKPLYLVLFVLPDDPAEWVKIGASELTLQRYAFWFRPALGSQYSSNERTVTVDIPRTNSVDLTFFANRIAEHFV